VLNKLDKYWADLTDESPFYQVFGKITP